MLYLVYHIHSLGVQLLSVGYVYSMSSNRRGNKRCVGGGSPGGVGYSHTAPVPSISQSLALIKYNGDADKAKEQKQGMHLEEATGIQDFYKRKFPVGSSVNIRLGKFSWTEPNRVKISRETASKDDMNVYEITAYGEKDGEPLLIKQILLGKNFYLPVVSLKIQKQSLGAPSGGSGLYILPAQIKRYGYPIKLAAGEWEVSNEYSGGRRRRRRSKTRRRKTRRRSSRKRKSRRRRRSRRRKRR